MCKVAVSGGFDPLHPGHLFMIDEAAKLGHVVVIVNSDAWLVQKKGQVLLPLQDRLDIMRHIVGVEEAVPAIDEDVSVSKTLEVLKPDVFLKSGDRPPATLPLAEIEVCRRIGCKIVFKESPYHNHSSQLLSAYIEGVGQ